MQNKPFYMTLGLAFLLGVIQFCSANYWMDIKYWLLDKIFEQYLQDKTEVSGQWMSFMTILSTIFAVFFVYSGFKIDKDLRELHEKWNGFLDKLELKYEEKIKQLERKTEEEKLEINIKNEEEKEELRNENSFIKQITYCEKQINEIGEYDEAIKSLNVLLKDEKNRDNNQRYNQIILLISKAFLWKWASNEAIEDLSQALIFAKEAIEDASDPYIVKLVDLFNENWKNWKNS